MDGWKEIAGGLPSDVLASIGNLALAFATVDVEVSIVLSRGKPKEETAAIHRQNLGSKLEKFCELHPLLAESATRIKELSATRNDLMHGYIFSMVWSASPEAVQNHLVVNFGAGRTRTLCCDDLDKIAAEAISFARSLATLI